MPERTPGAVLRGAVDLTPLRNRPAQPTAPASEGTASGDGLVVDVSDQTFPQMLALSRTVPVVVDLWAEWCGPCKQLSPVLEKVVRELGGRLVLAKVDVDANPQLAQAFRAQSIPMVVALVSEQAVPLFTGAVPEQQVREVFDQLLQVAAQNGVTGTVSPDGVPPQEQEETAPSLHEQAFAAIEAGDYGAAEAAFRAALQADPRDGDARAGLAQVALLARARDVDAGQARAAAAAHPDDVHAQFAVADLDLVGGHVEDAFDRLLDLFAAASGPDRQPIRERLLELFEVVGDADPRVLRARTRLASLLF